MKKQIKTAVKTVKAASKKVLSKTKVTSPKKQLNTRDYVVAWGGSFLTGMTLLVTTVYSIISQLLASVADYVLPYLQQVPRADRPAWLALAAFLVMGLVILNKRRIAGPDYVPPPPVPPPLPTVANPAAPTVPVPQGQPLPPGATVNPTTPSAF